jgi:hypothetical protein
MNATQTLLNTIDRQTRGTLREHAQWLRKMGQDEEAERFEQALTRPLGDLLAFVVGMNAIPDDADIIEAVDEAPMEIPDSLTVGEYLPLARRTLPDDLTKRERLAMLAMGCIGEAGELYRAANNGWDLSSEIGDVEWYATILEDECRRAGIFRVNAPVPTIVNPATSVARTVELVKKAIFHGKDKYHLCDLALAAGAFAENYASSQTALTMGEIRSQNIRKLAARYPEGFVEGGGER